jgi:hypothetical protein
LTLLPLLHRFWASSLHHNAKYMTDILLNKRMLTPLAQRPVHELLKLLALI